MAGSMMLKNENGQIAGYVLLTEKRITSCLRGSGGEAALFVMDDQGNRHEFPVKADGRERVFSCDVHALKTAYAAHAGKLLAAANDQARAAFSAMECAEKPHPAQKTLPPEENSCNKSPDGGVYTEKGSARLNAPAELQRRWPPPVCWPGARYTGGVWTQEEGGKAGRIRSDARM